MIQLKNSLYDVQERIADYLRANDVPLEVRSDDSSMPSVSIDVSLALQPTNTENSYRLREVDLIDSNKKLIQVPFTLSILLYAGKSEDIEENKRNIENIYIQIYFLIRNYKKDTDYNIELDKHTLQVQWDSHPILNNLNIDETRIRITIQGRAMYG